MTRADARRQLAAISALLRAQGQAAAASHVERRRRLAGRYRYNGKAPAGRLRELPRLESR
jgi:hypothetical protein